MKIALKKIITSLLALSLAIDPGFAHAVRVSRDFSSTVPTPTLNQSFNCQALTLAVANVITPIVSWAKIQTDQTEMTARGRPRIMKDTELGRTFADVLWDVLWALIMIFIVMPMIIKTFFGEESYKKFTQLISSGLHFVYSNISSAHSALWPGLLLGIAIPLCTATVILFGLRLYSELPLLPTLRRIVQRGEESQWQESDLEALFEKPKSWMFWGMMGGWLLSRIFHFAFLSFWNIISIYIAVTIVIMFIPTEELTNLLNDSGGAARFFFSPIRYVSLALNYSHSPALSLPHFYLLHDFRDGDSAALLKELEDPGQQRGDEVRYALHENPARIGSLRLGLSAKDITERLYSAWALGQSENRQYIAALIPLMNDSSLEVCQAAWQAIERLQPTPDQVKTAWLKALDSQQEEWVARAIQQLAPFADLDLKDRFTSRLTDDHAGIRRAAQDALKTLNIPEKEWVGIWIDVLKARTAAVRSEAVKALPGFNDPRVVAALVRRLRDRSGQVRAAAQQALSSIADQKLFVGDLRKALTPSIANLSHTQRPVRHAAWDTLRALSQLNLIDKDTLYREMMKENPPLSDLLVMYRSYPEAFAQKPMERLMRTITQDVNAQPEAVRDSLLLQTGDAIQNYVGGIQGVSRDAPIDMEQEYDQIGSLVSIVHDNLPICLDSIRRIGLRISDMSDLIQHLPMNNPLTRILRMLGEEPDVIGGYVDVTRNITQAGLYGRLYESIVQIADREQRSAPAQIEGMLELLRDYRKQVRHWKVRDWTRFSGNIAAYFENGFPVLTPQLFEYFQEHRRQPNAIAQFKADIEKELSNMGWGNYYGLSAEFKQKYGLSDSDEIALTAHYLSLTNLGVGDFLRPYNAVHRAIGKVGLDQWHNEVPEAMRQLYSLKGSRTQLLYQTPADGDPKSLDAISQRLAALGSVVYARPSLEKIMDHLQSESLPALRADLVGFVLSQQSADIRAQYATIPEDLASKRAWLSQWYTLMTDTLKVEYRASLTNEIQGIVAASNLDSTALEERLSLLGFRWIDPKVQKGLPDPDPELLKAIGDKDYLLIQRLVQNKWMVLLPTDQLKDDAIFNAYVDRGWPKLLTRVQNKLGTTLAAPEAEKLQAAIHQAQIQYLADAPAIQVLRQQQLVRRLTDQMIASVYPETDVMSAELDNFHEIETASDDKLYVGYFDDLLHLAGEFIMTGVCTLRDRARQVLDGKAEGYHFGVLALKNEAGRVLGFSQVQILKTPIKGSSRNEHFRILCLTGINLSEKELPMERRKAVLALLKTADVLARKAGLDGAAVVAYDAIHSNQHDVKAIIRALHREGVLQSATLASRVMLSEDPEYYYQEVYMIHEPQEPQLQAVTGPGGEIVIQPSGLPTTPSVEPGPVRQPEPVPFQQDISAPLIEKTVPFADALGTITRVTDAAAVVLTHALESTLAEMPSEVVNAFRSYLHDYSVQIEISSNPEAPQSQIRRTPDKVELVLGADVLLNDLVEPLGLALLLAEVIAAFVVPGYETLKAESASNENAWYKLELIKALLNYRIRLPLYYKFIQRYRWNPETYWHLRSASEQVSMASQIRESLDGFTAGIHDFFQWNVFLSVMDDADPNFMVANYMHLVSQMPLVQDPLLAGSEIFGIIEGHIGEQDVLTEVSLVRLRNVFKGFFLDGVVRVKLGDQTSERTRFENFDDTDRLARWNEILDTTSSTGEFYETFENLLRYALPLNAGALKEEMHMLFTSPDLLKEVDRPAAVRNALRDFFIRRIGAASVKAIIDHLQAKREGDIPLVEATQYTLMRGQDADQFGAYRRQTDWLPNLFALHHESGEGPEQGRDYAFGLAAPLMLPIVHHFVGPTMFALAEFLVFAAVTYSLAPIFLAHRVAARKNASFSPRINSLLLRFA